MSESNTPTSGPPGSEQEGTSVSSPNNPKEQEPDAVQANPEGPGEQAGGGQHGG
jgi:hypothetical protein